MPSKDKASFTVNVEPRIKERLEAYADRLNVSVNWLCVQAINQYLESLPEVEDSEIQIINTRET